MTAKKNPANQISLPLDINELEPNQIRLIKQINSMLYHMLATEEEAEYFQSSKQLFKLLAAAIKSSHFSQLFPEETTDIPYAKQALEFSLDELFEHLQSDSPIVVHDN